MRRSGKIFAVNWRPTAVASSVVLPKNCVLVEGEISPTGWCPIYTTFSPLDRGGHARSDDFSSDRHPAY